LTSGRRRPLPLLLLLPRPWQKTCSYLSSVATLYRGKQLWYQQGVRASWRDSITSTGFSHSFTSITTILSWGNWSITY